MPSASSRSTAIERLLHGRHTISLPRNVFKRSVQSWKKEDSLKTWPVFGIFVIQTILLLAHWFLYHTWIEFYDAPSVSAILVLRITLLVLAFSFVAAALLSFKYSNPVVTAVYK